MGIPSIDFKRLTRMLCYSSYKKMQTQIKIKSNNKNEKQTNKKIKKKKKKKKKTIIKFP